jgi:hypothetical protein
LFRVVKDVFKVAMDAVFVVVELLRLVMDAPTAIGVEPSLTVISFVKRFVPYVTKLYAETPELLMKV